jgi:sulfoxide reductase heme-binding subunit YedZ
MFITIRSLIHIGCLSPLLWLGYILYYGDISQVFGADPIKELIHFLGLTALYIFSALFVLRIITQLNGQAKLRSLHRDLGLWGLFWLCLHLTSYLLFELALDYRLFLSEIIKRPYLIIGAIAFLLFLSVAISSMPYLRRKMAKNWFVLHQFSNLAILLAIIHYYWSVKSVTLQPLLFMLFAALLLLWKLFSKRIMAFRQKLAKNK